MINHETRSQSDISVSTSSEYLPVLLIIGWVRGHVSDWDRLMVLLSGRSGRATAGVTWATNNMCHLLWRASERRLDPERVYIAPHAPSFVLSEMGDGGRMKALEAEFREIWCNTRTSVELARLMFAGYPSFRQPGVEAPPVELTPLRPPAPRIGL